MSFDQENFPELPSTWVSISVEDAYANVSISEKIPTKSYSSKGKLAVVDQGSAHIGGFTDEIEKAVNVEIPVIVFGDHTRSIKFVDFPFAAGADGIKILKPNTYFVPKLFYWFLKAIKLPDKGYARHFQYLRTSQIALPPLNEQKRIADKLDRLLAKVDSCRERCDRIPLILKRFRQSVLAAATSGELTEDWRIELKSIATAIVNSTPSSTGYEHRYLRDLVQEPLRNGKSVRDGDGTLVLRLSCLRNGRIDWTEVKRGDWGDINVSRFLVKEGDFLVARGNGSQDLVGRGSLVVEQPQIVAFPDTMIRVRPNKSSILPHYLQIIWDGNEVREQIELTARTTAGIWKIAQGDLENLLLPVPQIHEQQEIVRRVELLFAFADRLESRYQTARAKCDQLTPALLEKAFQGELVPQDPNDEPASVLLERIKSLRSSVESNQTKPQRRARRTG
jgi:restriction endonuclease S subunit